MPNLACWPVSRATRPPFKLPVTVLVASLARLSGIHACVFLATSPALACSALKVQHCRMWSVRAQVGSSEAATRRKRATDCCALHAIRLLPLVGYLVGGANSHYEPTQALASRPPTSYFASTGSTAPARGSSNPEMINTYLLTSRLRRNAPWAFMRVGVLRLATRLAAGDTSGGRAP